MFLGESDNVAAILKRCHMLVMCSDYEGFPNAVLEAMAASLPVVATPAGDSPSLVQDGVSGYVVEFDNASSMAGRIVQLANSPELRRTMGESGRRRAEEHYDIRRLPDRLIAIFRDLAKQQRRMTLLRILDQFQPDGRPDASYGSTAVEIGHQPSMSN
jgi:glycosyltransferase involved in cell wall biosynthesis